MPTHECATCGNTIDDLENPIKVLYLMETRIPEGDEMLVQCDCGGTIAITEMTGFYPDD